MGEIKAKLKLIMESIKTFDNRINQLETSAKLMNSRQVKIKKNLGVRCNQIERKLNAKVDSEIFSQLQEKVDELEKLIKTNEEAALRKISL